MLVDYPGLTAILNQIPLGILFVNDAGEFLFGNENASRLLDLDPTDLMARGIAAIPKETQLPRVVGALRQAERQKEKIEIIQGKKILSVTVSKGGLSILGESCTLILISDISELTKMREYRSAFQNELLHRIRGSLTSVMTSLAVLDSESLTELPTALREIISLGHAEVRHLHTLVNDVGELLAIESRTFGNDLYLENIDLRALFTKFIRRVRKSDVAQGRTIELELLPPDSTFLVVADYEKLVAALNHLVTNALAYSTPPSPVKISVALAGVEQCEIRIQDFGQGFDPLDLPHVFAKFYRFRKTNSVPGEGSGLGLFLAQAQIEGMNGVIKMDSELGKGSLVTIRLPIPAGETWMA